MTKKILPVSLINIVPSCRHRALLLSLVLALLFVQPTPTADWPAYRRDSRGSAVTSVTLRFPMQLAWRYSNVQPPSPAWPNPVTLGQNLMEFDHAPQPVVSGGKVFFGSSSDDTIRALDAATGELLWRYTTGGPVRFAPQVYGGRVYAVSDDGFVYCLDAGDGEEVWSFRAALDDDLLVGDNRMISRRPLRTGVVVDEGNVYVVAGMWPREGVFAYALDAVSGEVQWVNDTLGDVSVYDASLPGRMSLFVGSWTGFSPQGRMLIGPDRLVVPMGRSPMGHLDRHTGELLSFRPGRKQMWAGGAPFAMVENSPWIYAHGGGTEELDRKVTGRRGKNFHAWGGGHRFEDIVQPSGTANPYDHPSPQWMRKKGLDVALLVTEDRFYARRGYSIALADDLLVVGEDGAVAAFRSEETQSASSGGRPAVYGPEGQEEIWRAEVNGQARGLAVADGRIYVSTDRGEIYCFAPNDEAGEPIHHDPAARMSDSPESSGYMKDAVKQIAGAGMDRGYALVTGDPEGTVATALATGTGLRAVSVVPDEETAHRLREKLLDESALYGSRIHVFSAPSDGRLPFARYFANVVIAAGDQDVVAPEELYRLLRPSGGLMLTPGMQREDALSLFEAVGLTPSQDGEGAVPYGVRGHLPGAWIGEESEVRKDRHLRGPLRPLWFGSPSKIASASRSTGLKDMKTAGGRYFQLVRDRLIAVDGYNGTELWLRDVPYETERELLVDSRHVFLRFGGEVFGGAWTESEDDDALFELSEQWSFRKDPEDIGLGSGWHRGEDEDGWEPIEVPAFWSNTHAGDYMGYGWYKTRFYVPEEASETEHELRFGGVDEQAWVYVNGELIGKQTVDSTNLSIAEIWNKPFSLKVGAEHLRASEENLLVVRCHGSEGEAGIFKPVEFALADSGEEDEDVDTGGVIKLCAVSGEQVAIYGIPRKSETVRLNENQGWRIDLSGGHTGRVMISESDTGLEIKLITESPSEDVSDARWHLFFDFRPKPERYGLYGCGTFQLRIVPGAGDEAPRWRLERGQKGPQPELESDGRTTSVHIAWSEIEKIIGKRPRTFGFDAAFHSKAVEAEEDTYSSPLGGEIRYLYGDDNMTRFVNNGWTDILLESAAEKEHADLESGPLFAGRAADIEDSLPGESLLRYSPDPEVSSAPRIHPLTGAPGKRMYGRNIGCGGAGASAFMMFTRSNTPGMMDLLDDSGVRHWGGVRPSCGVSNMLVGGGVLMVGNEDVGCACLFPFNTHFGLAEAEKPLHEDWGEYLDIPVTEGRVRMGAINLGAPGSRRDDEGTLWLNYPWFRVGRTTVYTPGGARPNLVTSRRQQMQGYWPGRRPHGETHMPVEVETLDDISPMRVNADRVAIENTDRPWIYTSKYRGVERLEFQLDDFFPPIVSRDFDETPSLDGWLDKAFWGSEPCITLSGTETELFFRHDENTLYIGARSPMRFNRRGEPHGWRAETEGEEAPVWEDDSIEVFLADAREHQVLHLGASASGARYSKLARDVENLAEPVPGAEHWNSAVYADDDEFTAEISVPLEALSAFGLDLNTLAVNVNRNEKSVGYDTKDLHGVTRAEALRYLGLHGRENLQGINTTPLGLGEAPDEFQRDFTVRLYFAEIQDVEPGERVFDVKLQGETVLEQFDVAQESGGTHIALIKEFRGVAAAATVVVEMVPAGEEPTPETAPILNAIELHEEGFEPPDTAKFSH